MTSLAPGSTRAHDGQAGEPCLYQDTRHPLARGETGEHEDITGGEQVGDVVSPPHDVDALCLRARSERLLEWAVTHHRSGELPSPLPQALHDVDEPIRPLSRVEVSDEDQSGGFLIRARMGVAPA